jgi:hypothetical protein
MGVDTIEKIINEEKKQAMFIEESLADYLFDKLDLLESGESLQDYYESINDYLDGTMNV